LEKPTGVVTRAMGDVHPFGNPHYWLDPENGRRVAKGIADKLSEMRSSDAAYFNQRFESFSQRLTEAEKRWDAEMLPYHGRKVITYHRSWPNFLKRFGLVSMGEVEPRPGIPPTPSHTLELINMMKRENVKIILVEPYFDLKTPNSIARETGAKVVVMPPSVGGEKEITDYFKLFDYDLALLTKAFQETQ
jgi:ABC-type Zn uptake system ZnuABC Zn-binding protein ZnuA